MATTNELAALRAFLALQPEVAALVGDRVYAQELPDGDDDDMPEPTVIVTSAGMASMSLMNRSYMPIGGSTKDIKCYGATPLEARSVWNACHAALKDMRRQSVGGVLLYSVVMGGAMELREPVVDWPMCFSACELTAAEEA